MRFWRCLSSLVHASAIKDGWLRPNHRGWVDLVSRPRQTPARTRSGPDASGREEAAVHAPPATRSSDSDPITSCS